MQHSDVAARDRARTQIGSRALRRRQSRLTRIALAAAASALASASLAGPALANAQHTPRVTSYNYTTVVNQQDATFNQLLGINNFGEIAGYFGSGAAGHPNKGYLTTGPLGVNDHFLNENVAGSVQTQVTGLNDHGVTVGFWSDQNNQDLMNPNFGFYSINGHMLTVNFPTTDNASPTVNQLLGVNNDDVAVGFYTDANGNNHGYTYNIGTGQFHQLRILGTTSTVAAAINNMGDIAGSMTTDGGLMEGYLLTHDGHFQALAYPGAAMTQALGVNDEGEVVGFYQLSDQTTYGFTWTAKNGFTSVSDPNGVGATTVNGVNDAGTLVGFYTDGGNNVDGMIATPQR